MTDGSVNLGMVSSYGADVHSNVDVREAFYGTSVGTTGVTGAVNQSKNKTIGLTTDSSKSGMVGTSTITSKTPSSWCIKY